MSVARFPAAEAALVPAPAPPATPWTDKVVADLRDMWSANVTAEQIAHRLNDKYGEHFTRNAVLGKADRLKLSRRKDIESGHSLASQIATEAALLRKIATTRDTMLKGLHTRDRRAAEVEAFVRARDQSLQCTGVTIIDLKDGVCCWPKGDPLTPEFRYCGAAAQQGGPYCKAHREIAYHPPERRFKVDKVIQRGI